MLTPLHIYIDSREQSPWAWEPSDVTTEIAGLSVGDYALASDTEEPKIKGKLRPVRFAIERKSLDDMLGSISRTWETGSLSKLMAQTAFPARVVIVEADFLQCCFSQGEKGIVPPPHNHPGVMPAFVARRVAELTMAGVSVLFAGSAELAAGLAYRIFKRRLEVAEGIA